jgi:hypothetical protein
MLCIFLQTDELLTITHCDEQDTTVKLCPPTISVNNDELTKQRRENILLARALGVAYVSMICILFINTLAVTIKSTLLNRP